MKRIVRNKATRAYLSADEKWVTEYQLAESFENMESVFFVMQKNKLTDVELVIVMGENPSEEYDVVLPLFSFGASAPKGTTYDRSGADRTGFGSGAGHPAGV